MQEDLIAAAIAPHGPLELGDCVTHANAHGGWSTDEDTCSTPKVLAQPSEQVRDIRATILGTPSVLLLDGRGQEGESHQILLELRGCRREAEIEALHWAGSLLILIDIRVDGTGAGSNCLRDVQGEVAFLSSRSKRFWSGDDEIGISGVR
jgi:hypothetical protein